MTQAMAIPLLKTASTQAPALIRDFALIEQNKILFPLYFLSELAKPICTTQAGIGLLEGVWVGAGSETGSSNFCVHGRSAFKTAHP
jgi:hypothetical protein